MIYIDKSKEAVQVYVPVNGNAGSFADARLVVKSTVDLVSLTLPVTSGQLIPESGGALYLRGEVEVPEGLTLGEWEYELLATSEAIEAAGRGLLVVVADGEPVTVKEYNPTIEYKQYGE